MLEIKNLHFQYEKNNPLLKDISLLANRGDIIWLRGPNGCGKSTLLRIIAQLIETDCELYYDQKLVNSREELLAHLMYIPSEPYLFDYLTGEENVAFLKSLFNVNIEQFSSYFNELIDQFQMKDALKQFVQEYSLGMRHKLYWSAAFARNSSIILLDEPFSSLDSESQEVAIRLLKSKAEEGAIIIFVSHLSEISTRLASRSLVLEDGIAIEKF
ncbi:ABC transporter ATP-binding protein [Bacillus mycoides]|uniref:ATP-binding cassette domain-containing protein n=1 Tax=Bacillus mycoides TaxID=1405 RepID=UPI0007AB3BA3|nr:ABC transporter ATP-binding protein [Bacillus mycoides]KZE06701.1 ABC transporter ATP-binding protein [Bacillus mycoides]SCC63209.1 Putative ABC-transoprted ATP-binding protein [Bacillus mycoides]